MKKVKQIVKQNSIVIDNNNRGRARLKLKSGAGDGIRTHGSLLGKQALFR